MDWRDALLLGSFHDESLLQPGRAYARWAHPTSRAPHPRDISPLSSAERRMSEPVSSMHPHIPNQPPINIHPGIQHQAILRLLQLM